MKNKQKPQWTNLLPMIIAVSLMIGYVIIDIITRD